MPFEVCHSRAHVPGTMPGDGSSKSLHILSLEELRWYTQHELAQQVFMPFVGRFVFNKCIHAVSLRTRICGSRTNKDKKVWQRSGNSTWLTMELSCSHDTTQQHGHTAGSNSLQVQRCCSGKWHPGSRTLRVWESQRLSSCPPHPDRHTEGSTTNRPQIRSAKECPLVTLEKG